MPDKIVNLAKALRRRHTDAEKLLWKYLRAKQLDGIKFRRQEPIDNFIVDFVTFERRLIIEIDGGQHAGEIEKDKDNRRDEWFSSQGFRVLRFWNNEVLTNLEGVLETIRLNILANPDDL